MPSFYLFTFNRKLSPYGSELPITHPPDIHYQRYTSIDIL